MTKLALGFAFALTLLAGRVRADVPADYDGTPFGGTPWPVPGRIEFEDFDLGGQGVGWSVDDHTGNFGEPGCAGNGYRDDPIHPQLCMTNTNPGENDLYTVGPLTGQKYPTNEMPVSIYIGYTHAVDWVKLTVNVAEAGTYLLSSSFASEPGGADGIKVQVSFNDVLKADATLPGTGGYHNWADYLDFATVELDAGVQVVQFAAKSMHVNYDYLQLSRVLPGGGVDDGSGASSGGTGGSGGGSAGSGGTPTGGAGGAPSAAGAGGSGGSTDPLPTGGSGGASVTPTPGGAAGTTANAPAAGSPGAVPAAASDSSESGGCRLGGAQRTSALSALAGLLLGAMLLRRSRR